MERFFDDTNDPSIGEPVLTTAAYNKRLDKASRIIRTVQRYPDVIGMEEMENLTVLQFRGRTGPYLEPAPGTASLDLLRMVREGLLSEVRAAINRAKTENTPVRREGVPIKEAGRLRQINVEVIPLKVPPSGIRCSLSRWCSSHPLPTWSQASRRAASRQPC